MASRLIDPNRPLCKMCGVNYAGVAQCVDGERRYRKLCNKCHPRTGFRNSRSANNAYAKFAPPPRSEAARYVVPKVLWPSSLPHDDKLLICPHRYDLMVRLQRDYEVEFVHNDFNAWTGVEMEKHLRKNLRHFLLTCKEMHGGISGVYLCNEAAYFKECLGFNQYRLKDLVLHEIVNRTAINEFIEQCNAERRAKKRESRLIDIVIEGTPKAVNKTALLLGDATN